MKGDVLVPGSRFVPKCECDDAKIEATIVCWDETNVAQIRVSCDTCGGVYDQELIEHGRVR